MPRAEAPRHATAFSLAVVCEGPADLRTATQLADCLLCAEIDWFDSDTLPLHRTWCGHDPAATYLPWREVHHRARERGIRAHGHFGGEPGAPDAHAARLALLLLASLNPQPSAALLIRDSDGQPERHQGLKQARANRSWPFATVIGLAHPKRECWVLAAFEPGTQDEETALEEARRALGFDPRRRAHELSAAKVGARRNAKEVLQALIGSDPEREARCWQGIDLPKLEQRGKRSGLAAFLTELRERLVPLFRP